jgi:hypothetical protein
MDNWANEAYSIKRSGLSENLLVDVGREDVGGEDVGGRMLEGR